MLSGCAGGGKTVPSLLMNAHRPASVSPQLGNVPIPSSGAYLGAFDNADPGGSLNTEQQLESLEKTAGKRFAIQLTYGSWANVTTTYVSTNAQLQGDATYGRIPNLSWTCGDDLNAIATASPTKNYADYKIIKDTADALKGYGHPVLLRFFHEFNGGNLTAKGNSTAPNGDNPGCFSAYDPLASDAVNAQKEGAQFVAAWQNMWNIFHQENATNVSFEWCPNTLSGHIVTTFNTLMTDFYPGDRYVDWIGIDQYDDPPSGGFEKRFTAWYSYFSGRNKPLIVSETGEVPSNQPGYNPAWSQSVFFSDIRNDLDPKMADVFPNIKAVNYFDSAGHYTWYLDAGGKAGITKTLNDPYFIVP